MATTIEWHNLQDGGFNRIDFVIRPAQLPKLQGALVKLVVTGRLVLDTKKVSMRQAIKRMSGSLVVENGLVTYRLDLMPGRRWNSSAFLVALNDCTEYITLYR
jgi:hypothetical protein